MIKTLVILIAIALIFGGGYLYKHRASLFVAPQTGCGPNAYVCGQIIVVFSTTTQWTDAEKIINGLGLKFDPAKTFHSINAGVVMVASGTEQEWINKLQKYPEVLSVDVSHNDYAPN